MENKDDCTRFPSLFADDVGGHHAPAGADIREFRKRKTGERGTDFAVEQQRIEVDELFRELDATIIRQRRESLAGSRHTLLHKIIAVSQGVVDGFVPTALIDV